MSKNYPSLLPYWDILKDQTPEAAIRECARMERDALARVNLFGIALPYQIIYFAVPIVLIALMAHLLAFLERIHDLGNEVLVDRDSAWVCLFTTPLARSLSLGVTVGLPVLAVGSLLFDRWSFLTFVLGVIILLFGVFLAKALHRIQGRVNSA